VGGKNGTGMGSYIGAMTYQQSYRAAVFKSGIGAADYTARMTNLRLYGPTEGHANGTNEATVIEMVAYLLWFGSMGHQRGTYEVSIFAVLDWVYGVIYVIF